MIKIKTRTLLESVGALTLLGQLKLPITSVRPIAKILRVLETELADVQTIKQQSLLSAPRRLAEDTDESFNEKLVEFNAKINDEFAVYQENEIELDIDKFSIDLLGDTKEFNSSALMTLDWLIE